MGTSTYQLALSDRPARRYCGQYWRDSRHGWRVRKWTLMTHSVNSQPSITALQKFHSITSSAVASTDCGMVRPNVVAVLRFTTNSNLVGFWTGRSAGFSPRRMRST